MKRKNIKIREGRRGRRYGGLREEGGGGKDVVGRGRRKE